MAFRTSTLIGGQAIAAGTGMALLAAWPPPTGRLLLVPLRAQSAPALVAEAVDGGARLLGQGPLPGSQVVIGDRSAIARHLPWSVLVAAAPPAGCGADSTDGVTT